MELKDVVTREQLNQKRSDYQGQLDALLRDVSAVGGAIQAVDQLLAELDAKEEEKGKAQPAKS